MNQFFSRRSFILIPIMSILKFILKPKKVLAAYAASDEDWNLSKEDWKKNLVRNLIIFCVKRVLKEHLVVS